MKFYITTTLPYVNADPHIGFALEIIEADVLARFHKIVGDDVFFNTGTDEHGLKVFLKAKELNLDPQKYCDEKSESWKKLREILNLSYNNFIRTTDDRHIEAAQEFWKRCDKAGDIYKKKYKIKYCVGCEMEKTDSELVDDRCPLHPDKELEIIEEENYFFRFSKYQKPLLDFYEKSPEFVCPDKRFNEIKKFVAMGLEDFSISRLKSKMPWGVPVPDDAEQVMYVWFDALVNYISAIGWPNDMEKFNEWWPGVQIAGKDNLRQQSAMWQAMLMSSDLPNSKQIFINGFVNIDGQKMSKSLGNVIAPDEMVAKFGVDATRYLMLTLGNFGEDTDAGWQKFTEKYNADLANGLGNLISRVFNLIEKNYDGKISLKNVPMPGIIENYKENCGNKIKQLLIHEALQIIFLLIRDMNREIEEKQLWQLVKDNKKEGENILGKYLLFLESIANNIAPIMPETSEKILNALNADKIVKGEPLFLKIK